MEQATIEREWFSYPEAETYTNLSRVTLWRAVNRGDLRAAKVGKSVRIRREELDRFMERASER